VPRFAHHVFAIVFVSTTLQQHATMHFLNGEICFREKPAPETKNKENQTKRTVKGRLSLTGRVQEYMVSTFPSDGLTTAGG